MPKCDVTWKGQKCKNKAFKEGYYEGGWSYFCKKHYSLERNCKTTCRR